MAKWNDRRHQQPLEAFMKAQDDGIILWPLFPQRPQNYYTKNKQ